MASLLKYNGSKWILMPWIVEHFPEHKTYVDLFGGSGAAILRKPRSKFEYFNDVDDEVVNFFECLQRFENDLIRKIELTPYSDVVYRKSFEIADGSIERAWAFYVRCWMGQGNNISTERGFRLKGNVGSHGGYNPAKLWADTSNLRFAAERFKGVTITNMDYRDLLDRLAYKDVLVYADPPYSGDTRAGKMYKHEMMDQRAHMELIKVLENHPGPVILSGYDNPLYQEALKDWERFEKASRTNSRASKQEIIWRKV